MITKETLLHFTTPSSSFHPNAMPNPKKYVLNPSKLNNRIEQA